MISSLYEGSSRAQVAVELGVEEGSCERSAI
jgi:hypothetical protein